MRTDEWEGDGDEGRVLHLRGLDRFEAREKIVEMLQAEGLLVKVERTSTRYGAATAATRSSSRGCRTSGS
jgi:valyl-tRNA synthetase